MADELSPTMEEGTEQTPTPEVNEQLSEEAELLERLKAAGMTKPEQVDGAIRNAQRTYAAQSERDRLANQLEAMEKKLAEMETKPSVPSDEDFGQPVDLQAEIRKGFRAERQAEQKAQLEAQQQMMAAYNTITTDEDYHLVKEVWEEKLKDPNFVFQIQMGQKNPMMEYQNTLRTFYKGIAQKSVETIERLSKGTAPTPHVEDGQARTPDMPSGAESSNQENTINTLTERADSGKILSEDEELALIQASLSKGLA
jgi:hypothetical protein